MIRRKYPSNTILPESLTLPYNNCTFITQPKGMTILYVARGLHFRRHGSADASSIPAHISDLACMSIPSTVIRHPLRSANHRSGTSSKNGIMLLDPSSSPVSRMHAKIPGGHLQFQNCLATHMIHHCLATDVSRVNGKVNKNLPCINRRLRFGWAREQRAQYTKDFHEGIKMPTISNLCDYGKLPASLKDGLFTVLEQATQLVRRKYPGAMSDSLRTNLFASKLNGRLGNPRSCNKFEYINIVLSYNTVLPSHLDEKNDHRPGYDHCAVYAFSTTVSRRVCRVAIIMTSAPRQECGLRTVFCLANSSVGNTYGSNRQCALVSFSNPRTSHSLSSASVGLFQS